MNAWQTLSSPLSVDLKPPRWLLLTVNEPELTSAYHCETEASLRCVFAAAPARAPCIIILDEIDAICPRCVDDAGGELEKRVVATLLTEMDGVDETNARVSVVAATNRPNSVDPALRRPGRFDREVAIGVLLYPCYREEGFTESPMRIVFFSGVPDLNARISILNFWKRRHTSSRRAKFTQRLRQWT